MFDLSAFVVQNLTLFIFYVFNMFSWSQKMPLPLKQSWATVFFSPDGHTDLDKESRVTNWAVHCSNLGFFKTDPVLYGHRMPATSTVQSFKKFTIRENICFRILYNKYVNVNADS